MADKSIKSSADTVFGTEPMAVLVSKYKKALMGVAALLIFYFHTHACYLMDIGPLGEWEAYLKRIFFFGVDMFMMLSGMGVVFSLAKNSIGKFYVNRLKRIYPPILIAALVMMYVDKWPFLVFIKKVTGYAFFFEWFYSFLWFFTAILVLYLVSPLLNKMFEKSENKLLTSLLFLVYYILVVNLIYRKTSLDIWDYYGFTNRIPIFVFGMYLGHVLREQKTSDITYPESSKVFLYVGLLFLGGFLAFATSLEEKWFLVPISNCFMPNILLSISVCFLLALLFDKGENSNRFISKITDIILKILGFYGMISFEFYIVQEWICSKMLDAFSIEGRVNSMIFNILLFIVVTVSALVLYYVAKYIVKGLEKACLRKTKH